MTDKSLSHIENISTVCDTVRTCLGPLGTNKMVLKEDGGVKTSTSGSKILEELELTDPSFRLLEQTTSDFASRHGDGSTTVATLLSALLSEAASLLEKGLHPTVIENGYREALEIAANEISLRERPLEDVGVEAVVKTALTETRDPNVRATVADSVGTAIQTVADSSSSTRNHRQVKVVPRLGGALSETELVRGVVLDTNPVTRSMPRRLDEAQIVLLSTTVDLPHLSTETSTEGERTIAVDSVEDRIALGEAERDSFKQQLNHAIDAGCSAMITTRAINDRVTQLLANNGILGLSQIDEADIARIARATGTTVVPSLKEIDTSRLGTGTIRIQRHAGRDMTFVESESGDPVFTLFVRAPDPRSIETFQQSVEHSIRAGLSAKDSGTVVPGGGAIEMSAVQSIQERSHSISGPAQLAVEAFGDALSAIPQTLAMNSGLDRHSSLARLYVSHSEGRDTAGINATRGVVDNVMETGPIVDPPKLKQAAWTAATDLSTKLIRIDDRIVATNLEPDQSEQQEEV
ncbi:TCP-1/cpn60 chaperonin family protein [Halobellus sp. EA9]|uniref:TCP-1/cpn60 chaperonin family protein n=1 Tax=Halobellus sp. EA9 TaxID=3421647 RepID=UPI003EB9BE82